MRATLIQNLIAQLTLIILAGSSAAATNNGEFTGSLCPTNAKLVVATRNCTMWARTVPNLGTREEMMSHAWQYFKTIYYIVGREFTNQYETVEPFPSDARICISPGGSVLVNNDIALLSARDLAASTNVALLTRLNFEADARNYDGWTLELSSVTPATTPRSSGDSTPRPVRKLNVKYHSKMGGSMALYDYRFAGEDVPFREDWQDKWPIYAMDTSPYFPQIKVWSGREWAELQLGFLTRVVAGIDIDYLHDDGNNYTRWFRIVYHLEDDGSRGVKRAEVYRGDEAGVRCCPKIEPLDSKGVEEADAIMKDLLPSTGEGLTNMTLRVNQARDSRFDRTYLRVYPCDAVPPKVMRLLQLMGGFQYEAEEILKEEKKR